MKKRCFKNVVYLSSSILLLINRVYSDTFESKSDLSVDSAYILIRGSVPLCLTMIHVSSSTHILAPSKVSSLRRLPCLRHASIILSAISFVGHSNLDLYWNIRGRLYSNCDRRSLF